MIVVLPDSKNSGQRIDECKLHEILDSCGIANAFEIYAGTHTIAVADRFQRHT